MFSLQDTLKEKKEEGHQEGRQKGRQEGIEEGIEKGRQENAEKIASSMLADGFNVEVVRKHTGLSEEAVRKLSKARPKK